MIIQYLIILFLAWSAKPANLSLQTHIPTNSRIIFSSTDEGKSWNDLSYGLPDSLRARCLYVGKDKILLGYEQGVYRKNNSIDSRWERDLLLKDNVSDFYSCNTEVVLRTMDHGLFKELPGSGVWLPVYSALFDKRVYSLLETADGIILATTEKGVFKSADSGKSWNQVIEGVSISNIAESNGILIAAGHKGLYNSTDKGDHWSLVFATDRMMRKVVAFNGTFYAYSNGGGRWSDVIADPERMSGRLYTSTDGGKNWYRIDENLFPLRFLLVNEDENKPPINVINDIAQIGNYLFCSRDTGVFRSSDNGKTWNMVLPSYGRLSYTFALSGKTIYAVLVFNGC